jgi:uncharacterized membrane protein
MKNYLVRLFEPKANGPETAALLADLLHVKISGTTLKKEIEQHPNYPSLLSVSDVLNNYGIENLGVKFNPEKIIDIPTPFITQITGRKSVIDFFTVVKEIPNGVVKFFDPEEQRWDKLSLEDFLKRSLGIALLTEVADNAGEQNYDTIIKAERNKQATQLFTFGLVPLLVIAAIITGLFKNGLNAILPGIFLTLTLTGCTVGALLLLYELDRHNPILKQICSAGKKVNCGAVLQSKASKIWGISWSAIGFSYFMGMLLLLLSSGITSPAALLTVALINAVAIPYTFFSIYYQWRVAKQWCMLCLTVQALLFLQLSTALIGGWHTLIPITSISTGLIIQTAISFAIPFIAVTLLMPALQKAKESKSLNTELQKLKHNPQIFEALLQKQKVVTENPEGLGLILGNADAKYKLIKVCNPFCGPCAAAHTPIEQLLHNNPDVQVQILFTTGVDENDYRLPPIKHLLAIAEKNNEGTLKKALDDWYLAPTKNYDSFAAKYPMNGELKKQSEKISKMSTWCNNTRIEFTPTFFISIGDDNGESNFYQLPGMYSVNDLKYFFSV